MFYLMDQLNIYRSHGISKVVVVLYPVLKNDEIDGSGTDQYKGQEEDPDHGVLDPVFKIPVDGGIEYVNGCYQECESQQQENQRKNVGERDQTVHHRNGGTPYNDGVQFIHIIYGVVVFIQGGPFKDLLPTGIEIGGSPVRKLSILGDEISFMVLGKREIGIGK